MIVRSSRSVFTAACLIALVLSAIPAAAQITTGTVLGNVKDAQGGVVPGATVVLVSEARGTKSRPRSPTRPATTCSRTSRRTPTPSKSRWTGSRPSQRTGVQVSGGDRVAVPALTLEPGGAAETVTVIAESPLVQAQSGERSFAVTTEQIENLPINHGNFTSLTAFTPGVVAGGASAGGTRLGGAGQNNIMMDGISAMDTGNNGQMLKMNIESIAEVKILTQGYQAEYGRSSGLQITAVTKSGTNRFRGSAYDIQTNSDWNANSWVNEKNGDPKPTDKRRRYGYSIGGPVGKPGGNNKLFFFYSHEYRPTNSRDQQRQPDPVSACRPRSSAPATSRRRSTTTARCSTSSRIRRRPAALQRDRTPAAASRTAACSAGFRRTGCTRPGLAILNRYPLPNADAGAGHQLQLRELGAAPSVEDLTQQPAIRLDYQLSPKLRVTGKYSGAARARADDARARSRASPTC